MISYLDAIRDGTRAQNYERVRTFRTSEKEIIKIARTQKFTNTFCCFLTFTPNSFLNGK